MTDDIQAPKAQRFSRRTKFIAGGAAALLALGAAAGVVHAQRGHFGHGGGMAHLAERYDTNKDGKVSQEEIDANRSSWHGEFDKDKSNGLTLEEFSALWLKARNQQLVREFQGFDRDGDGKVTLDEYKQPMAGMVSDMDMNGDGFLSRDDRRRGHGREGRRGHGMMERDGGGMMGGDSGGMMHRDGGGMMGGDDDMEQPAPPPAQ